MLDHTGGSYSHGVWWIIREFLLRNGILGNLQTPWNLKRWKINFRSEVWKRTTDPQLWIKEVDGDVATTADGKTDHTECLRWRSDGLRTYVKYLDYFSTIDIKHEAFHRQRHRYESMFFMRSVDPNLQAGPFCAREQHKPSAHALVSFPQVYLKFRYAWGKNSTTHWIL